MLLPVLAWRRRAGHDAVRLAPAYAIGTLACFWVLETGAVQSFEALRGLLRRQ